jgi:alkylhydroperoxidase family enzyme
VRLPAGWIGRLEAHLARQDRRLALLADVSEALLGPEGSVDPALRRAVFEGDSAEPDALRAYVEKVRLHAYRVTDDDVAALRAAGFDDDALFELTLAAAAGAGFERLYAGLRAVGDLD